MLSNSKTKKRENKTKFKTHRKVKRERKTNKLNVNETRMAVRVSSKTKSKHENFKGTFA